MGNSTIRDDDLELAEIQRVKAQKESFDEAIMLLKRCRKALNRTGWEEGESDDEVLEDVDSFLSYLELGAKLEKEMTK